MRSLVVFSLFSLTCFSVVKPPQPQKYNQQFEVKGTLILKKFYGPPGFGKSPKVDQTDKQFVLQLPAPMDFAGTSDPSSPNESGISEMQLLISEKLMNSVQRFVGKSVSATVIPFHAISRLQHTKVLFEVKNLKAN